MMNKKDIKVINPQELGWLEYKLNSQEMDYVWRCIKNKKGDEKKNLAGNISASNILVDRSEWFYHNTLKPLILQYSDEFINIGRSFWSSNWRPIRSKIKSRTITNLTIFNSPRRMF